jgi:hypothetical protein
VGVHLYCILPGGPEPPGGLTGVGGQSVEFMAAGSLACWLSRHDEPPEATRATLREHAAVAAAALDPSTTPVPVRFGQWLADTEAASARLLEEAAHWHEILAGVAGHAEFGVRIALPELVDAARDVHPQAATGRDYMAALARRQAGAAQRRRDVATLADWVAGRVGSLAARTHVDAARGSLGIAHLVAWRHADAYRSMLVELCAARIDLRIATSGPWPPYSFVN